MSSKSAVGGQDKTSWGQQRKETASIVIISCLRSPQRATMTRLHQGSNERKPRVLSLSHVFKVHRGWPWCDFMKAATKGDSKHCHYPKSSKSADGKPWYDWRQQVKETWALQLMNRNVFEVRVSYKDQVQKRGKGIWINRCVPQLRPRTFVLRIQDRMRVCHFVLKSLFRILGAQSFVLKALRRGKMRIWRSTYCGFSTLL